MPTIEFHYENDFKLSNDSVYKSWIEEVIESENRNAGELNYVFCGDEYLLRLHQEYLNKDDLTDIITFDYVDGKTTSGDIFISTDRVKENAEIFNETFDRELLRVMSHGLLHLMGYSDKTEKEIQIMREKEEEKIKMFHLEQ